MKLEEIVQVVACVTTTSDFVNVLSDFTVKDVNINPPICSQLFDDRLTDLTSKNMTEQTRILWC